MTVAVHDNDRFMTTSVKDDDVFVVVGDKEATIHEELGRTTIRSVRSNLRQCFDRYGQLVSMAGAAHDQTEMFFITFEARKMTWVPF